MKENDFDFLRSPLLAGCSTIFRQRLGHDFLQMCDTGTVTWVRAEEFRRLSAAARGRHPFPECHGLLRVVSRSRGIQETALIGVGLMIPTEKMR